MQKVWRTSLGRAYSLAVVLALLVASLSLLRMSDGSVAVGQAPSNVEELPLAAGCSNVTLTWPDSTPAAMVTSAVNPAGALIGIWRLDAMARRFGGWSPVPGAPNDFTTVNRLEPVFICMRQAGTLARPALSEGGGRAASPTPPPNIPGQGVCSQSNIEATGNIAAGLDATRKRDLTPEVVAIKTFGLHEERHMVRIVLYHLPSGSQVILDSQGRELLQAFCSAEGEQALTAILHDPDLLARALELAQ